MYPTFRAAHIARLAARSKLAMCVGLLLVAGTLAISTAVPSVAADISPDPYTPYTPAGRWVPSGVAAFDHLSRVPDVLVVQRTDVAPEPGEYKHYQGIARVNAADGTPYFMITKAGVGGPITGDESGYLLVARMGSRDHDGERLRTNAYAATRAANLTQDQIVVSIPLNGTNGWPAYRHPGGMQLVGNILAIGAEKPYGDETGSATILFVDVSNPEAPRYIGKFNPPHPDARVDGTEVPLFPGGFGTDPVGFTAIKTADGKCCRYVIVAAGGDGNEQVRFFLSEANLPDGSTDLAASPHWTETGRYTDDDLSGCMGTDWPISDDALPGGQHQMLNFVREGGLDGQLYLIGARRDGVVVLDNPEYLDMYKVNLSPAGIPAACPLDHRESTTFSQEGWGYGTTDVTFSAGTGIYISPTGEMIVYVTSHHADPVIRIGELRLWRVARDNSPTLRPTATVDGPVVVDEGSTAQLTGHGSAAKTKAFVQLFEDGGTGSSIDQSMMIVDYPDRHSADFGGLQTINVGANTGGYFPGTMWEDASSVRWFAPLGCTISLNDFPTSSDNWPGPNTVLLRGSGAVEETDNLGATPTFESPDEIWPVNPVPAGVTPNVRSSDDDIEGVTFYHQVPDGDGVADKYDCDSYYNAMIGLGWDLDNNGSYDATGTSASFSASTLDGPTNATVTARAQHPTDTSLTGTGEPISVPVSVRNVAPQVSSATLSDSLGHDLAGPNGLAISGLPVSLAVRFTDPGVADTQTARVSWGDGSSTTTFSTFHDAHGGVTGELRHSHVFPGPGTYDVATTVTDDDLGATTVHRSVVVVSAADLIVNVASRLTTLIGQSTSPTVRAALTNARDELIGNHAGHPPTNGAVDKLSAGDPSGAITKLRAAIGFLQSAEAAGAGDLSTLKDLVGLTAESIATEAYARARFLFPAPTAKQTAALQAVGALITQGHQKVVLHQYLAACDSFRQAIDKAVALRR
jgi:hypothetical protein